VTDACVDLRIEQVAPGGLEEPENRLIGEVRRVGEVDDYLNVSRTASIPTPVIVSTPVLGGAALVTESRLAGGNVKAMVDEAGSRGGLGCSGEHGRPSRLLHDDGASHVRVYGAVVCHRAGSVEGMGVSLAARHRR
jgi:hypothetical protein